MEKTKVHEDKIQSLVLENNSLKDKITQLKDQNSPRFKSIKENIVKNQTLSKETNIRVNYNEQYSRKKNNVNILDVKEEPS